MKLDVRDHGPYMGADIHKAALISAQTCKEAGGEVIIHRGTSRFRLEHDCHDAISQLPQGHGRSAESRANQESLHEPAFMR
jgi:hypothetical protein